MTDVVATALTKTYPRGPTALKNVGFALNGDGAVAIIGPSGAGKTTLFRVLSRNTTLDSGTVTFDGIDLYGTSYLHLAHLRRRIGIIFQQHNLVAELSVLHNVLIGRLGSWSTWSSLRSLLFGPGPELLAAARDALATLGVEDKISARAGDLSGGEQQRVAIARLLLQDPDIILADEPIASVDPVSAEMILDTFATLAGRGKQVVCNLHDVSLARATFPRILALREGAIVFDGPSSRLDQDRLREIYGPAGWQNGDSAVDARKSAAGDDEQPCTCEERAVQRILSEGRSESGVAW